jgi:hypothetical protein
MNVNETFTGVHIVKVGCMDARRLSLSVITCTQLLERAFSDLLIDCTACTYLPTHLG